MSSNRDWFLTSNIQSNISNTELNNFQFENNNNSRSSSIFSSDEKSSSDEEESSSDEEEREIIEAFPLDPNRKIYNHLFSRPTKLNTPNYLDFEDYVSYIYYRTLKYGKPRPKTNMQLPSLSSKNKAFRTSNPSSVKQDFSSDPLLDKFLGTGYFFSAQTSNNFKRRIKLTPFQQINNGVIKFKNLLAWKLKQRRSKWELFVNNSNNLKKKGVETEEKSPKKFRNHSTQYIKGNNYYNTLALRNVLKVNQRKKQMDTYKDMLQTNGIFTDNINRSLTTQGFHYQKTKNKPQLIITKPNYYPNEGSNIDNKLQQITWDIKSLIKQKEVGFKSE